jgi:protein-tyrosine phosphatase
VLKEKGIAIVVNLTGGNHTAPWPGVLSIAWPVADGELPDVEVLQSLSGWLAELLRTTDKKILVHCVASVNRSSLLIGCILHRFLGLRGEDLVRYLEEKSGGYAILTNRKFREYLSSLGKIPAAD